MKKIILIISVISLPVIKGCVSSGISMHDTEIFMEAPKIVTKNDKYFIRFRYGEKAFSLITWSENNGLQWINLNELEYSERNVEFLNNRNYMVKNDISAAVKGSQETAITVMNMVESENLNIGVHYCSLSFKDGIQLKNRIKRRARNVAKEHEIISDEGTILKGVIYKPGTSLIKLLNLLKVDYNIPAKFIFTDTEKNRIEIGFWILEKIAKDLTKKGYKCFIAEEYPTADRLEVERIPLPI